MKILKILILGVLLGLAGCGAQGPGHAEVRTEGLEIPEDLRPLQGLWMCESGEGRLAIHGRTVQLYFSCAENGRTYRRNAYIESIDTIDRSLSMQGEKRVWYYSLDQSGVQASVMLRFFDQENHRWIAAAMIRDEEKLAEL